MHRLATIYLRHRQTKTDRSDRHIQTDTTLQHKRDR